jgi:predicted AlkP superfamily pyrophosphatase or phosphodiesterase
VTWNAFTGGVLEGESSRKQAAGPDGRRSLRGYGEIGMAWRTIVSVPSYCQWPHWMKRIKDHAGDGLDRFTVRLAEIHNFIVGSSRTNGGSDFLNFEFLTTTMDAAGKHVDYDKCDAEITKRAVEQLRSADPDVLFVYFGNVDETGHGVAHKEGKFSPENEPYCAALEQVD